MIHYYAIPGLKNKRTIPFTALPEHVLDIISAASGIGLEKLTARTRTHSIVTVRFIAMNILREHTSLSLKEIGAIFNLHHSGVIHGIAASKLERQIHPQINKLYNDIKSQLT